VQGPQAPARHRRHQVLQRPCERPQRRHQVGHGGSLVPVLGRAAGAAVHHGDHVEHLPGAHRIGDDVQPRPQPHRHVLAAQGGGQVPLQRERAVRQVAGGARRAVVAHLLAHLAPDAVGAHQDRALVVPGIADLHPHLLRPRQHGADPRSQAQLGAGLTRAFQQQRLQVGTVHGEIRRAVALRERLAEPQRPDLLPVHTVAHVQLARLRGHGTELLLEAPADQDPGGVGAELDAGADFAQRFGALVQARRPARLPAGDRGGQPAHAATGDQDPVRHARPSGAAAPRGGGLRPAGGGRVMRRPATAATRTAGCRRAGSSRPRSACRRAA